MEVIVVGFASRFFLGRGAALHLIRSQQASERTHFMRVVARCRVLQTTVFTRQTKVLGCCCCCCGLGPQWALDGPKLGPLMGPSLIHDCCFATSISLFCALDNSGGTNALVCYALRFEVESKTTLLIFAALIPHGKDQAWHRLRIRHARTSLCMPVIHEPRLFVPLLLLLLLLEICCW